MQTNSNYSFDAKKSDKTQFLRTALVCAGRGAVLGALQPEGLHTFRGGLVEVLRAVQALHDLVHVVIAGLHRLAFQRKLVLHVLHHPNSDPLALIKCHQKKRRKKNGSRSRTDERSDSRNAIIRQWS